MTDTAKSVNYSKVQLESLITAYTVKGLSDTDRKEVMEKFAKEFGKTVNSIRSKLSREKVYIKPSKTTKSGGMIVRKAELVEAIAMQLGVESGVIGSMEKATKTSLELILATIAKLERQLQD